MAGIDDIPKEFVRVLLTPPPEVIGEEREAFVDLGGRVERPVDA